MPQPSGYCRKCGYPIDAGQCPECGLLNPTPARLSLKQRRNRRARRIALAISLLLCPAIPAWANRKPLFQSCFPTAWLCAIESSKGSWALWATEALNQRYKIEFPRAAAAYKARKDWYLKHPENSISTYWQGEYRGGDSAAGAILDLSPNVGFRLQLTEPMRLGPIVGYGRIRQLDWTTLQLEPDLAQGLLDRETLISLALPKPMLAAEMLLIDGPEVEFLVPKFAIRQFCVDASAGKCLFNRYLGITAVRYEEDEAPNFDNPKDFIVPLKYEPFLLREPIFATVTAVRNVTSAPKSRRAGPAPSVQADITLNVGRRDGVLPGMEFFSPCDSYAAQARVLTASDHECTLEYADTRVYLLDRKGRKLVVPMVGWQMTTRCEEPPQTYADSSPGWVTWAFGLEQ